MFKFCSYLRFLNNVLFRGMLNFTESVREMEQYGDILGDEIDLSDNQITRELVRSKNYRSQRNFYITGFALVLFM